jgi:formylglycine-generating enzyme required for sulfatase activity
MISRNFLAILLLAITPTSSAPAAQPASTQPAGDLTLDLGNNTAIKLVLIPAGQFMMGSPPDERDRSNNESPQHLVRISKPFYMALTPVTQRQWKAVMRQFPTASGKFVQINDDNAMGMISWVDANEFCRRLSVKTRQTVKLPTEAQWEYACRAGSQTRFYYGDDPDASHLSEYAWFDKNIADQQYPHPVAQKKPNAWGLYDMHGNVNQWCADYLGPYPVRPVSDPTGPGSGTFHVFRGGSFMTGAKLCRDAARNRNIATRRIIDNGLRIIVIPRQ